ncbi:nondiscriminating aspartyl-tRNA synthetase [Edaphobacter aggregans]|uniref:Nondiscriminating aspartyl-tRNA synthetase n=1 Tax=Edaphobacter aggregans TaxID=570835 RepID=A0A428MQX6_9BACT|nr:aspartate--tRNA(Asn) ligase [Edaphobacter aggregans]RSL19123.1 nondiscriminating aspartyl-tRNA synthetase [Edaphobacter aggregans]
MHTKATTRIFIQSLSEVTQREVILRGWVYRLRMLSKTTFVILKDCSGEAQCVAATEVIEELHLKTEDVIEVRGRVRVDERAKLGCEVEILEARILNRSGQNLPFNSAADIESVGLEKLAEYRPLALRNEYVGNVFRIQAALLKFFREYLTDRRFTEIITSKIVASGTEGGTNLFELKYFDRIAYLAQSPQFYKEHAVAGYERVFETGHVYRAEPHSTRRHLTEYYSLDVEFSFIDGPEDVIQLERELLAYIFDRIEQNHAPVLNTYRKTPLPRMLDVPCWEFGECLELLKEHFNRTDLTDDLDPEAERQLCQLANERTGTAAVFVLGFPLLARPFYSAPRGSNGAASSFDLLFEGIEITTGGQRLHHREDLEAALRGRGIEPTNFENHLRMFDLGMPPHGGFAIGLERLTARILNLPNIRQAVLYPRDRYRVTP